MRDNKVTFLESCFGLYRMNNVGIVHVGAHYAQEAEIYEKLHPQYVLWIEGVSTIADKARSLITKKGFKNQFVVTAMISSHDTNNVNLYYADNDGASSSLFKPKNHLAIHPDVKFDVGRASTTTLNSVVNNFLNENSDFQSPNILVLDIQGAELEAIMGFSDYLDKINFIFTEISVSKMYKGAPKLKQIIKYLRNRKFELISSNISSNFGYGDALFIRTRKDSHKIIGSFKSKSKGQLTRLILINLGFEQLAQKLVRR